MRKRWLAAAAVAATCALGSSAKADTLVANVTRSFADNVVAQLQWTSDRIGKMLRSARAQRDDARTACANEALGRANAAWRHARSDALDAKTADARGDAEAVRRAVARLNTDRDYGRAAERDVDACFAAARATGETTVRVVVDAN